MKRLLLVLGLLCAACVPGPQGPVGPPGTNTLVYTLQFCNGVPATTPDQGLCISELLYVDHNGLTYLPPGTYTPKETGAACSFTVVYGCTIIQGK